MEEIFVQGVPQHFYWGSGVDGDYRIASPTELPLSGKKIYNFRNLTLTETGIMTVDQGPLIINVKDTFEWRGKIDLRGKTYAEGQKMLFDKTMKGYTGYKDSEVQNFLYSKAIYGKFDRLPRAADGDPRVASYHAKCECQPYIATTKVVVKQGKSQYGWDTTTYAYYQGTYRIYVNGSLVLTKQTLFDKNKPAKYVGDTVYLSELVDAFNALAPAVRSNLTCTLLDDEHVFFYTEANTTITGISMTAVISKQTYNYNSDLELIGIGGPGGGTIVIRARNIEQYASAELDLDGIPPNSHKCEGGNGGFGFITYESGFLNGRNHANGGNGFGSALEGERAGGTSVLRPGRDVSSCFPGMITEEQGGGGHGGVIIAKRWYGDPIR